MKRVFSGIQPSGNIHIGNYLGAIRNWVADQNKPARHASQGVAGGFDNIYCIVDMHAITVPQDPKQLYDKTYEILALLMACGLDPKKSLLFLQSQVPAHAELAWILNTVTYIGELERMTQYKDKKLHVTRPQRLSVAMAGEARYTLHDSPSVGLFDYPVLMAADILLYQTDGVPVGEDQKQHVELARDLAKRFNNKFGETFKVPEPIIKKEGARIMGLDDPTKKMSKSAGSEYNYITLVDKPDDIRKKISKAVTDSQTDIKFDPNRAGLYNLLTIYQLFSEITPSEIEKKFVGCGYGDFKKALAELIIEKLTPIQEKYQKLISDKSYLNKILTNGKTKASEIAEKTLQDVKKKVGFVL